MKSPFTFSLLVLLAVSSSGCALSTNNSCTADARSYDIALVREFPMTQSQLYIETCVGEGGRRRCESTRQSVGQSFGEGVLDGLLRGKVTALPSGALRLEAAVRVAEDAPGASTPISVQIKGGGSDTLLDVKSALRWETFECHPKPLATSL
jgi:hypothetical protein